MPPLAQIKHDINRSGWESTDFPSVCENCLPANPYVKMLKEDHGAECKLCTRPFTVFSWAGDGSHSRRRRTGICLTCARLKNACQCCIMDLQFGLPIVIRDKALEMLAPGPQSDINREYFAQNNERAIEEGRAGTQIYETVDTKARELLRRLAASKPYFRKGCTLDDDGSPAGHAAVGAAGPAGSGPAGPGPIRTRDTRRAAPNLSRRGGAPMRMQQQGPPGPQDYAPPADPNIMSLFVTGIEDDLPEHKLRDFFKTYGTLRSLVVSHMSHCAFVNYETRQAAERAAAACQGRTVLAGCPLRIRWGQPKAIGTMNKEQRLDMIRDGRSAFARGTQRQDLAQGQGQDGQLGPSAASDGGGGGGAIPAPPGADDVAYASLQGD